MAGTLTISTLSDGTNSTSATNPIRGSARAWAMFDSTPTIAGSYNVSSVTKAGTALYTINFTNAMANTNYAVVATSGNSIGNTGATAIFAPANPINASSCFMSTRNGSNSDAAYAVNSIVVFA